ncbi:Uncharacterised protein [Klebsiella pneumoniae]|nr:Uncharacterised protein [Klebsiella pneumoniae]SYR77494.1 Uncharacterised protein [Klebsiella pneumoniae]
MGSYFISTFFKQIMGQLLCNYFHPRFGNIIGIVPGRGSDSLLRAKVYDCASAVHLKHFRYEQVLHVQY